MGGKLTVADVERASQGMHFDGDGLYLQVAGPDSKSWIYRYTLHGKARWCGLGSARDVTLATARKKRDKARVQVREGIDLVAERKREKAARNLGSGTTFREAAESYIRAQENGDRVWSNQKHATQWSATLKAYAFPAIGDLPVEAIERAHIIRVLEPIWTEKPETARRVRGRLEAVLDWTIARGERSGENPASRGPLLKGLPRQSKVKGHHAALRYADAPAFMVDLQRQEGIAALALEFAIFTATRTGEVLGAQWSEIDTRARVWTIPAARMKGRREHRVPLSTASLAVLERARQAGQGSEHVFPNTGRGRPLSNMAMLKVLERMGRPELTTHGFRSTFRDWAAERTNFPGEVAEAALAHVIDDKTEAAYRRGDLFDKRRRLMDAWAEYCTKPSEGRVLPLRAAKEIPA
jgi:integrase